MAGSLRQESTFFLFAISFSAFFCCFFSFLRAFFFFSIRRSTLMPLYKTMCPITTPVLAAGTWRGVVSIPLYLLLQGLGVQLHIGKVEGGGGVEDLHTRDLLCLREMGR